MIEVTRRARCRQKCRSLAVRTGDPDRNTGRFQRPGFAFRHRHQCEIGDQLTPTPQVAGNHDFPKLGHCLTKRLFPVSKEVSRARDMTPAGTRV
ncbi:MAG: hypothetical protein WB709_10280 [Solirubrobacteraceae bacterium]